MKPVTVVSKKKGVRPDFTGVHGELVSNLDTSLIFGARVSKGSPYDPLLEQLLQATITADQTGAATPGLKFDGCKAKPSLLARAKKKGLKLTFAERDGVLYVRLTGLDAIEKRSGDIRRIILNGGPMPKMMILGKLRGAGDTTVDAPGLEALLTKMVRSGELILQEGDKYKVVAKRTAAA